ncbi:MAG: porin family protein [Proteobacteria bacterium]|nr:porin family protein [Pseudomonadota bacterium]
MTGKWFRDRFSLFFLPLLLLLTAILPTGASAQGGFSRFLELNRNEDFVWTGNVNLFVGQKFLDEADWEPVARPLKVGFEFDYTKNSWLSGVVAGVYYSKGDETTTEGGEDVDVEATTLEVALGTRKVWYYLSDYIRPYLGLGAVFVSAEIDVGSTSDDDSGFGPWAEAGAYFPVLEPLTLGVGFRWSKVDVDLLGQTVDAGGWHAGATLGIRWKDF